MPKAWHGKNEKAPHFHGQSATCKVCKVTCYKLRLTVTDGELQACAIDRISSLTAQRPDDADAVDGRLDAGFGRRHRKTRTYWRANRTPTRSRNGGCMISIVLNRSSRSAAIGSSDLGRRAVAISRGRSLC
jgi:hypothetical protein